jgi:hypothetical protein
VAVWKCDIIAAKHVRWNKCGSLGTASAVVFNKAAVFSTQTLMGGSLNGAAVVSGVTNGTLLRNSTSILIGDGNERLNGHIKKLSYYPKRLSNSELQALTA